MATEKQIAFINRLVDDIEHSPYLMKQEEFDDSPRGIQAKSIWEKNLKDWMLCIMASCELPFVDMPFKDVQVMFTNRIQEIRHLAPTLCRKG